jgi:hypothetical protein
MMKVPVGSDYKKGNSNHFEIYLFFLVALDFELRASHLATTPQPFFCFGLGPTSDHGPLIYFPHGWD